MDAKFVSHMETEDRLKWIQELPELKRNDSLELFQKSRVTWDVEGYENMKFFHGLIKQRRPLQTVQRVIHNSIWYTQTDRVKEILLNFYKTKFGSFKPQVALSPNHRYPQLSPTKSQELEVIVSLQEIKEAVWSCVSDKAPGPDGTFKVIKRHWEIIKDDFVEFINEFFHT